MLTKILASKSGIANLRQIGKAYWRGIVMNFYLLQRFFHFSPQALNITNKLLKALMRKIENLMAQIGFAFYRLFSGFKYFFYNFKF
jgi:hypothetical protein